MAKKQIFLAVISALLVTIIITGTASAHYCFPANKPGGAGTVGVFDENTNTFTPAKTNWGSLETFKLHGGFVTLIPLGSSESYDLFIHIGLDSALTAGPDGLSMCDGQGIDFFIACAAGQ